MYLFCAKLNTRARRKMPTHEVDKKSPSFHQQNHTHARTCAANLSVSSVLSTLRASPSPREPLSWSKLWERLWTAQRSVNARECGTHMAKRQPRTETIARLTKQKHGEKQEEEGQEEEEGGRGGGKGVLTQVIAPVSLIGPTCRTPAHCRLAACCAPSYHMQSTHQHKSTARQ